MTYQPTKEQRSLWKGLLAGAIAGVAATAVKTLAERFYPPHPDGEETAPERLAERFAGHPLDDSTREIAAEAIHWSFGLLTGAAYGALAEFYPAATAKQGASFGLALMTLTHEKALPAVDLEEPKEDQSFRERTSESATHLLYGVVAERVRSMVRPLLD